LTSASETLDNAAMNLTAPERAAIAEKVGVSDPYLYQCMTGRKAMKPEEAVRVERESAGTLRRWHLRPKDWHAIWPELIGIEGAPTVEPAKVA
jgi:DNA-binding transcriptional regulator YdaS (Cro superfamily)